MRSLAKACFWLSMKLMHVKTWQRFYTYNPEDWEDAQTFLAAKPEVNWRWSSCQLAWKLNGWSQQLDWDHWEHWACVHETCDPVRCGVCGGFICSDDIDE
jgi:hypothetical protein